MGTAGFDPDYSIPLGEILWEYLDALGMNESALATTAGIPTKTVRDLLQGNAEINDDVVAKREGALGRPAHFWRNLERLHRERKSVAAGRAHLATTC